MARTLSDCSHLASRPALRVPIRNRLALLILTLLSGAFVPLGAQSTGSILGTVTSAEDQRPLPGALIQVVNHPNRTLSAADARFILVGVPAGVHAIRIELLGFEPVTLTGIQVHADRATRVDVSLDSRVMALEGVVAEVERVRLVTPEINVTHEVILGRELRALPMDAIAEAIELTAGVTDGHFRGGRVGQEAYVIDGLEFKNQFEASSQGAGIELPPSALEELEVVTGGVGAQYGSALSGVVRYTTRRGNPERWESRASFRTDHWAPSSTFRGFSALSTSTGGPVSFLGSGTTLYLDGLVQGMQDADPRARGLTCLKASDTDDPALASAIRSISDDPATAHLHCPYTAASFPHQQGEKLIGFARLDRPLFAGATLTATLLGNRLQEQLYTPEFKFNDRHQLGQRTTGTLGTLAAEWIRQGVGSGVRITARGSALRLDRQLGALDPWTFEERSSIGGVGASAFRFLGEDFVRSPIEEQLQAGTAVPGYRAPGGSIGSPFGPAGEGIFFTEGTPELANWNRTEFLGGDLAAEVLSAAGHTLRSGISTRFFRIESYERTLSHLPGSSPNYARFFPATMSAFGDVRLAAADEVTIQFGLRADAFRAGLDFSRDRGDFLAPTEQTEWNVTFSPRLGVSAPVPGMDGRTAMRFNFGMMSQPPDFQFFLDTSVGDSLRTDIRRQGNPNLSFERGSSYELGVSHLISEEMGISLVGFRKSLTNLVAGNLSFTGYSPDQFTTGDFGSVRGGELSFQARFPLVRLRANYALQKATGVTTSAFDDPGSGEPDDELGDDGRPRVGSRVEFPLAFDRRHSGTIALFAGRTAGYEQSGWGASLVSRAKSGFPFQQVPGTWAPGEPLPPASFLPWTYDLDLRVSRELGSPPGCGRCAWRVIADGRNLLNRENTLALRRNTGSVAPSLQEIQAIAGSGVSGLPIPRESPRYSRSIDFDGDGVITFDEFNRARLAAALERFDPSLFFGDALQLRFGVEIAF